MARNQIDLSVLANAAEARRKARRRLRETASQVAQTVIDNLRVGDSVLLFVGGEPVTYTVEEVTWRAWLERQGMDEVLVWSGDTGTTLVRFSEQTEACALVDCRTTYSDPDRNVDFKPAERAVYLLDAEDEPESGWTPYRRHLATDDELAMFAAEAAEVAHEFALLLAAQAAQLNDHVDGMLKLADES